MPTKQCDECEGSGMIECEESCGADPDCERCEGNGDVDCPTCNGDGEVAVKPTT